LVDFTSQYGKSSLNGWKTWFKELPYTVSKITNLIARAKGFEDFN
jgi:hypothetical protein